MGGNSDLPRRYGRRDVKLGEKKCFTAEPKCGIICEKGGAECVGGFLSNLFEQKASYAFPERSDREKRSFSRTARAAKKWNMTMRNGWIARSEATEKNEVFLRTARAANYYVM